MTLREIPRQYDDPKPTGPECPFCAANVNMTKMYRDVSSMVCSIPGCGFYHKHSYSGWYCPMCCRRFVEEG